MYETVNIHICVYLVTLEYLVGVSWIVKNFGDVFLVLLVLHCIVSFLDILF